MDPIYVTKASGGQEPFSDEKLRQSIILSGVPEHLRDAAFGYVKGLSHAGITTEQIYKHIGAFLSSSRLPRIRHNLKRALFEFGPTGFPFEKFIGAILSQDGFSVQTDVILTGRCVTHELDVIAVKENTHILIECKFHNQPGARTGIKVAMYTWARFHDLSQKQSMQNDGHKFHEIWLVTNTKCTTDAIAYANCMGVKIVSWGYPDTGNLAQRIEQKKLYPVTCLSSIKTYHKKLLIDQGIVLCKDLLGNGVAFKLLNLKNEEEEALKREIESL